ncbi:MAG: helix-turn-helix domain-containing protein [Spirochaetales bacterium]|nr:helix-turn-helix domain-containing protein [Spirochaetales bacterium]
MWRLKPRILGFALWALPWTEGEANTALLLEESTSILHVSSRVQLIHSDAHSPGVVALQNGWTQNKTDYINEGFSRGALWLRMEIHNHSENVRWYLTVRNNRLDTVDFFLLTNAAVQTSTGGDHTYLSGAAAYPVFPFRLSTGESAQIYLRIESTSHLSFPLRIYSAEAFGAESNLTLLFHVLFLLGFAVFLIFHLWFNPAFEADLKWFFGGLVTCSLFYVLLTEGEGNRWLWPDSIFLKNQTPPVLILLAEFFLLRFVTGYLRLEALLPMAARFFNGLSWLFILLILLYLLPDPLAADRALLGQALAAMVAIVYVLIVTVILLVRKRQIWVRYLLACWALTGLAGGVQALVYLGVFPAHFLTVNGPLLAFPADVVLLTVSFLYRHHALRREQQALEEKINSLHSLKKKTRANASRLSNLDPSWLGPRILAAFEAEKMHLDENFGVSDLARYVGVRPDQISAFISKELASSFPELVNRYRVATARQMLLERDDLNILQIAFECGFGSKATFNRVFKSQSGQTPAEFRSQTRNTQSAIT